MVCFDLGLGGCVDLGVVGFVGVGVLGFGVFKVVLWLLRFCGIGFHNMLRGWFYCEFVLRVLVGFWASGCGWVGLVAFLLVGVVLGFGVGELGVLGFGL